MQKELTTRLLSVFLIYSQGYCHIILILFPIISVYLYSFPHFQRIHSSTFSQFAYPAVSCKVSFVLGNISSCFSKLFPLFFALPAFPTSSPTPPVSTAGNARTWHVSDDKQEQFLTDALYMLDVRVGVYKEILPPSLASAPSFRYASCPSCPRPNSSLSCAWLKSLSSRLEA